jgi:hypothetical protein
MSVFKREGSLAMGLVSDLYRDMVRVRSCPACRSSLEVYNVPIGFNVLGKV